MKRLMLCSVAAALAVTGSMAAISPAQAVHTLVVDAGERQCPSAQYTSIAEAVAAAQDGDVVRVCPGTYAEFVTIDKPISLLGEVGAVRSLQCFDAAPSVAGDLDPTTYAVLQRPAAQPGNTMTVDAPGVSIAGLVLESAKSLTLPPAGFIYDAGLHLAPGSAGAVIHDNVFRLNSLGIDLGSDGSQTTRIEGNCLRDNDWAMASQRQDFLSGDVANNKTFRTVNFAYEVGWSQASTRNSVFTENISRQDGVGFYVRNSSSVLISDNDVEPLRLGVQLIGGNAGITVDDNRITGSGSQVGITFTGGAAVLPSERVLVADNDISGFTNPNNGYGIGLGLNAKAHDVVIRDNTLQGNNIGISVNPSSDGLIALQNVATGNTQYGIFSRANVAGARYVDNTMLGNPVDAQDLNRAANIWTDNVCNWDLPAGSICSVD